MSFKTLSSYIIHSIPDNQSFSIDQKAIDASVLLRNLCEFTDITEQININCSASCLNCYINLINDYDDIITFVNDDIIKYYEKFFNDNLQIMGIIKNMCILDSDIFLNFIADYILWQLKGKKWNEIKDFLELEDDFTFKEREYIEKHFLEYVLSFDMKDIGLQFPFICSCNNFIVLKNKFYTPMNVLLGRVVERSDNKISFELSLINKTLKNEYDRYPLKVAEFHPDNVWVLKISCHKTRFILNIDKYDIKYFNKIKARRVKVYSYSVKQSLDYQYFCQNSILGWSRASSLDFVIPRDDQQKLEIKFRGNIKMLDYFDIQKCTFHFVWLRFIYFTLDFKSIYQKYVQIVLSKEIRIDADKCLGFYEEEYLVRMHKRAGAEKFCEIQLFYFKEKIKILKNFKEFIMNYMEDNGVVKSSRIIADIPEKYVKEKEYYIYSVSFLKENL